MNRVPNFWRDYGLPVVVCVGVVSTCNFLMNWVFIKWSHQLPVYLTGSLVALVFLTLAMGRGTVSARDVGLSSSGWKPQHRVLGISLILFMGYGGFAMLSDLQATPKFGDYCFWFFFLLQASLVELLVFLSIGFCLPENLLKRLGVPPVVATLAAAVFAGIVFGVYHYTHTERWWEFALFLIPVMWLNLMYFILTRNFHLTLLLHNSFAAVGFTGEQCKTAVPPEGMDPKDYQTPGQLTMSIVAFAVPYLMLHLLEWRVWSGRGQELAQEPADQPVQEQTLNMAEAS